MLITRAYFLLETSSDSQQSSGSRLAVVRYSSVSFQAVINQSSGSHQIIIKQSSGTPQALLRQSSVSYQSSGSHHPVVQSPVEIKILFGYLRACKYLLKNTMNSTNVAALRTYSHSTKHFSLVIHVELGRHMVHCRSLTHVI